MRSGGAASPGGGSSGTDFGHAFWRVRVFAGERITGGGTEGMAGLCLDSMWLYSPSVTDANLQRSKPTFETAVKHAGPSCDSQGYRWSWRNHSVERPRDDLGHLRLPADVRVRRPRRAPDEHRFRSLPQTVPSTTAAVGLVAFVASAAGKPTARCAFDQPAALQEWHEVRRVALRRGLCAAGLEAGTTTSCASASASSPTRAGFRARR
jgi:hypothetical protein